MKSAHIPGASGSSCTTSQIPTFRIIACPQETFTASLLAPNFTCHDNSFSFDAVADKRLGSRCQGLAYLECIIYSFDC